MAGRRDRFDEVAFPALLRAARTVYASAGEALARVGCDDVPRNGSYVISAIARTGAPFSQIIEALGVSKQAAGQLVDTLVLRGYLDRSADLKDRRRVTATLTERGRAAARACRSAGYLVTAQEGTARTARELFRMINKANDQPTADLLTQRLEVHEKTAWMLRSLLDE